MLPDWQDPQDMPLLEGWQDQVESIGQHGRREGEQLAQSWGPQGQSIGALEGGASWVW